MKEVKKIRVAFLCVHNSCRSQIAETLGKLLASDVFESYSAGTCRQGHINQDARRLMLEQYHIDMQETQYSKTLEELPPIDIVITMGCNVVCPNIPCMHKEDWGLEDPSGKGDEAFVETIQIIHENVLHLAKRIVKNKL